MRRTRYTITFGDGTKTVFLGYPDTIHESAQNYYDKRIAYIIKGDYRKIAEKQEAIQNGGFTIDQKAVDEAIDLLDIKWPVDIRKSMHYAFSSGYNGMYKIKRPGGVLTHAIMVKGYLAPVEASNVLWHELTHAMQFERAGDQFSDLVAFHRNQSKYSYKQRPIEIEANEMADLMSKDFPLCY